VRFEQCWQRQQGLNGVQRSGFSVSEAAAGQGHSVLQQRVLGLLEWEYPDSLGIATSREKHEPLARCAEANAVSPGSARRGRGEPLQQPLPLHRLCLGFNLATLEVQCC